MLVLNFNRLFRSSVCRRLYHAEAANGGLPSHFTLNSGSRIPSVALGTWKAEKDQVGGAIKAALNAGYRHIDCAWHSQNEEEVGKAVKESGVPRSEIWLTSKLWNSFHAPEDVESGLDDSLLKLGTDYLDLYLIHWPVAFKQNSKKYDKHQTKQLYATWQKLEEMVIKGKVINIGVSNFTIQRMMELYSNPLKIPPAVNQVELNYWFPQPELVQWSSEAGIQLEAFSPFGSDRRVSETLSVPVIKEIAKELGITPAQVVTSWQVQRGVVVLPKSVTPSRVEENIQIAKLPDEMFQKLEKAAISHTPERGMNPSKGWGLDFDVFESR